MRFLGNALVTILLLVIVGGLLTYWYVRQGLSARAQPSRVEEYVAHRLRSLSVPSNVDQLRNPYAQKPETWKLATAHFLDHCAICHDADGRGKGLVGRNLYPKAPDMTKPDTQELSDGELFYIIENGIRFTGMPAWGEAHSQDETWQLVSYIRHLPRLSPKELEEMTRAREPQKSGQPKPHEHAPGAKPH